MEGGNWKVVFIGCYPLQIYSYLLLKLDRDDYLHAYRRGISVLQRLT